MATLTNETPDTQTSESDEIKNHPTANLTANKKAIKDLTKAENEVLTELRKYYIESIEIEIEQHKSIFDIEVAIDEACKEIFEKRKEIIQQFTESPLKHFWLRVFKVANISLSEYDEQILKHLIDVRSKMYTEPKVKMIIEFEFENNPYFSNNILTKTYYIKCNADPKNVILYDGIEITSTEGTKIEWKTERLQFTVNNELQHSFFEFFNNHSENDIVNRGLLSEEIAFGFFLREKVIPKAIYFFTGEIHTEMKDLNMNDYGEDEENDENDIDYDGDSEADSDTGETHHQYVEFVNEFDTKEQQEQQRKSCENISSDEERILNEAENQPLIDTGDDS